MAWYRRAGNLFRSRRLERELDDELAFHMAERIDELVAAGMPESEARREALRRFGNLTAQKERTRDMDVVRWLEAGLGDLRYGLRQLRSSPGFAVVAVLSLALGIGANSAIFQLIDALRLRNLPVKEPGQLAMVGRAPDFYIAGSYRSRNAAFTYAQFEQLRARQQAFSSLLASGEARFNLSRGGEARFAEGLYVSPNYLEVLGITPLLGRSFAADDRSCASAGAVLNFAFWQREFGGDPAAIGRTIQLDGRTFPILGVTPPAFFGLEPGIRFDVALPLCAENLFAKDGKGRMFRRDAWWLMLIGRLQPGWTVERAADHLRGISPAIFRESLPESYRPDSAKAYLKNRLDVIPAGSGASALRRRYENPLWLLLAMTGLVLLTACANLANLLLARASAREREIAVRQAIGASRARLIGQLLAESLLLAALGGALGAALAQVLSRMLVGFLDSGDGQVHLPLGVDWRVFAFTAALALVTCLLFGLAPAIRATRNAPAGAMRGGRSTGATRERHGLRRALVVCQVALSLVLLISAVLFSRSLGNLLGTSTGMNTQGVLVAAVRADLPNLEPAGRRVLVRELQDRVRSQPGVRSAAMVVLTPFAGATWNSSIYAEGDKRTSGGMESLLNCVGPRYFQTMAVPLLAGRDFGQHDDTGAPRVAIVNQAFAARFFEGRNPVGRTFRVEGQAGQTDRVYQIVGLVANTKYNGMREPFRPIAFFPVDQNEDSPRDLQLMIRSQGPLGDVIAGVRRNLAAVNPALLVEFQVLEVQIQRTLLRERLMASLSLAFGVLAGLLSALGLYGVMSYLVARRRNEIGVRMALGATRSNVMGLVVKEAAYLLAAGLLLGLGASLALSRFVEALLFGIKPNDPLTVALAAALLAGTALVAGLVPARRAARLDPAVALREE